MYSKNTEFHYDYLKRALKVACQGAGMVPACMCEESETTVLFVSSCLVRADISQQRAPQHTAQRCDLQHSQI